MSSELWKKEMKEDAREIESFGTILHIKQDFSGELGATVWDCALVLAKYFENTDEFPLQYFKNKKILELGAGTGLLGIILARLGAKVDITDREKLQDVIKTNISLNEVTNNATAKVLDWEDKNPQGFSAPYDMIIASDVVADCYEESSTALIETLNRMSNESTVILLAYELRDLSGKKFFQLLKTSFTYKKIPDSKLNSKWNADDIGIFQLWKNKT